MKAKVFRWVPPLLMLPIASGAGACSVADNYRVPTTLQLAEQADVVVLARVADGGTVPSESTPFAGMRKALLIPFAALKGSYENGLIQFDDARLSNERMPAAPSDPRNLVDANADVFSGSCNRWVFKQGMIVVSFLKRSGNKLFPIRAPFSRALEDVPFPDALWVKAVRLYVRIAAVPLVRRHKEMQHERDLMAIKLDDPDARLLALELDRALHSPSH